jgi:hypothetical protein
MCLEELTSLDHHDWPRPQESHAMRTKAVQTFLNIFLDFAQID